MSRGATRGPGVVVALAALAAVTIAACAPAEAERQPGWDLRVAERVEVAVGATAPLTLSLAVDRGLVVSKDAAVILDLVPDPGITVKKQRLGRGDAVDPEADAPRFAIPVRGDTPGDRAVQLHLRCWLCGARSCWPIDARRVTTVVVTDPTAGIDAGLPPAPDAGARRPAPGPAPRPAR